MPHWDCYLCLFELEATHTNNPVGRGQRPLQGATSPTPFPWPLGAALVVLALGTVAATLWHL